jgi:hypothetical protein
MTFSQTSEQQKALSWQKYFSGKRVIVIEP